MAGHELTCTQFGTAVFFSAKEAASHLPLRALLRKIVAEFTRGTVDPAIRARSDSIAYFVEDKDACADTVGLLEDACVAGWLAGWMDGPPPALL